MFSFLEKQKYPVILLVVGVALFLLGYFQIEKVHDVSSISLRAQPIYPILIAGLAFSFLSIAIYVFDELTLELQGSMKTPVEKEIGVTQDSYGVGTGVFWNNQWGLSSPCFSYPSQPSAPVKG